MKNTFISINTKEINKKHHYLFKIRPFDASKLAPYAYLWQVRMHTENNEQHLTLDKWISKSRELSTATMKSTNTERDDIFDLKISTNSVYTTPDVYHIFHSWLDVNEHSMSMPHQDYFTEYEFDCIDLSKFTFCTFWSYYDNYVEDRFARSCEIVIYIDGIEKYSNIFNGLSSRKSHFNIVLNESGTKIKEVSVN